MFNISAGSKKLQKKAWVISWQCAFRFCIGRISYLSRMTANLPEVWLRGPLEGIPALLQPVAHALLEAVEEIKGIMEPFPDKLLWERPAGVASVGFHLQHMAGVVDRLSTYARNQSLTEEQMTHLKSEGKETALTSQQLIQQLEQNINKFLEQLRTTDSSTLTEHRSVGRKALPSTVMGLLFHAAEHSMRHTGQLLVTARVVVGSQ
jgi:uncharacterized damage-inducible protein DinB